jgi:glycosyltransferase involved in cell wall biosynthesis
MGSDTPAIAVVTPFLDKSHGSERCLAEQVERIAHHYSVCIYTQRVSDLDLSGGNISIRRIPAIRGPHIIKYIWFFVANQLLRTYDMAIRGARYPVRYSPCINCLDANLIAVHILFHSLCRSRQGATVRVPSLAEGLRMLHRWVYYRLIMYLEKLVYRRQGVSLIYVSQRMSQEVMNHTGRSNPGDAVIHHGVDTSRFNAESREALRDVERAKLRLASTDFVLLLIGNDWITKGLKTLIAAVAIAGDSRLKVVVVGSDSRTPFERQVSRAGRDRIIFLPPDNDVLRFYALADAYVGPSLEDAFALPPLEAMACGLPVIVSARAGVSELVTDGENGLILRDPCDARDLASRITYLLANPDVCKTVGRRARKTAMSFTWDNNGRKLKRVIDLVLTGGATR